MVAKESADVACWVILSSKPAKLATSITGSHEFAEGSKPQIIYKNPSKDNEDTGDTALMQIYGITRKGMILEKFRRAVKSLRLLNRIDSNRFQNQFVKSDENKKEDSENLEIIINCFPAPKQLKNIPDEEKSNSSSTKDHLIKWPSGVDEIEDKMDYTLNELNKCNDILNKENITDDKYRSLLLILDELQLKAYKKLEKTNTYKIKNSPSSPVKSILKNKSKSNSPKRYSPKRSMEIPQKDTPKRSTERSHKDSIPINTDSKDKIKQRFYDIFKH